jgi:hypothetical protein
MSVAWEVTTGNERNTSKLVMVKRLSNTDSFYITFIKLPSAETEVLARHWFGFSCRPQGVPPLDEGSLQTAALSMSLVHTAVMAMAQRTKTRA